MVTNTILNSPQINNDVLNTHLCNSDNVGDKFCGPHHYFKELKDKHLDLSGFRKVNKSERKFWANQISQNSLIIGGGGLLNIRHFEKQMKLFDQLEALGKKTVIWGAGHNQRVLSKYNNNKHYNIDTNNFGIVGTRDYSVEAKRDWVPCVSCLHPLLDKQYTETREVGVLYCTKTAKNKERLKYFEHFPSLSNMTNLEEMIRFIGSSSTVVTDSYHAMYWGILLGKKTLVIPTTSKFYDFKYKSVISSYENFERDLKKTQSYSGVLEECREINLKFAEKVFNYLNI